LNQNEVPGESAGKGWFYPPRSVAVLGRPRKKRSLRTASRFRTIRAWKKLRSLGGEAEGGVV